MKVPISLVSISTIFFALSLTLIYLSTKIYKPVLSSFPIYPELEIQFYFLTIGLIFGLFSSVYFFVSSNLLVSFNKYTNKTILLSKKLIYLIYALEVMFILYFVKFPYNQILFKKELGDLGISPFNTISMFLAGLFLIFLMSFFTIYLFNKRQIKSFFPTLSSLALIIFLSFSVYRLNEYDYAYFAGPINDLLHGKNLLVNSPSQYGFLSIAFLSIPFQLIELNLFNIVLLHSVAVTLGFILIYFLCKKVFESDLYSLFVIITIIFFNYLVQIESRGDYPQTHVFRFGLWIILALLICWQEMTKNVNLSVKLIRIIYLVVGISTFWVFDNGIYILLAFLFYNFYQSLVPNIYQTLKNFIPTVLRTFLSVLLVFSLVTLIYKFLNLPINWSYFLSDSKLYLSGFGLVPFPISIWPWTILVTYLVGLIYLFNLKILKIKTTPQDKVFSFVLFYGIFHFSYFMGRSHLNNLHHVSIPFLIIFFYLLKRLLDQMKLSNRLFRIQFALSVALFLIIPYYLFFLQGILNLKNVNFINSLKNIQNRKIIEETNFKRITGQETFDNLVLKYGDYIKENGITLVSVNDTWYLTKLKLVNNIESNNLSYFVDPDSLKKLALDIVESKAKYIFVTPEKDGDRKEVKNTYQSIYAEIDKVYAFKESLGSLDVLEYKGYN